MDSQGQQYIKELAMKVYTYMQYMHLRSLQIILDFSCSGIICSTYLDCFSNHFGLLLHVMKILC